MALAEVAAVVRPWFAEPHSAGELRAWLHELYPTTDAEALTNAVRAHLPLLQVPVAGAPWGVPGNPTLSTPPSGSAASSRRPPTWARS